MAAYRGRRNAHPSVPRGARLLAAGLDVAWNAIALHTTPGIPGRLGPEIVAINLGVLTDALGIELHKLESGPYRARTDDIHGGIRVVRPRHPSA